VLYQQASRVYGPGTKIYMPELQEVEDARRRVELASCGHTVKDVQSAVDDSEFSSTMPVA
jgi:hypothetical protein